MRNVVGTVSMFISSPRLHLRCAAQFLAPSFALGQPRIDVFVAGHQFSARLFARDFVRNARRFHERKQFVDRFLRRAPNAGHVNRS